MVVLGFVSSVKAWQVVVRKVRLDIFRGSLYKPAPRRPGHGKFSGFPPQSALKSPEIHVAKASFIHTTTRISPETDFTTGGIS